MKRDIQIYKYEISSARCPTEMPVGAKILSAAEQHGELQVWAEVDPKVETELRDIRVYGTGWEMDDVSKAKFIATCFVKDLVLHLYDFGPL